MYKSINEICLRIKTIQLKTNTIQFIRQGINLVQFYRKQLFVYKQNWQNNSILFLTKLRISGHGVSVLLIALQN
jgi:hypothetical protein